jgi:molybdopterin synthase sulfur carrier subunit
VPGFNTNSIHSNMIRIVLPFHLRTLSQVQGDVLVDIKPPVTVRAILDALEERYPMLRGTIRDHVTGMRRPLVRFYACEEDISFESVDAPIPESVAAGREPFFIIGAIAGG